MLSEESLGSKIYWNAMSSLYRAGWSGGTTVRFLQIGANT